MDNVITIREKFINLYDSRQFVEDKTGADLLEIIGAQFYANAPSIFGIPNQNYIQRELEWYHSMSLNVGDIRDGAPRVWQDVSSYDGTINSNYGWAIWHRDNYDQYERTVHELRKNPSSRRAIMIYTRPSMWRDYNKDGMSDFMCTNTVQYFIRQNKLISYVNMRSNDVVYGYKNDYAWQNYVAKCVAADLELNEYEIIWNVGSLHLYERDFWMIECWKKFGQNLTKKEYANLVMK